MLDIKKLAGLEWHYFHRRFRTPFLTYLIWQGLTKHYNKKLKFKYEYDNFIYLDKELAVSKETWQRLKKDVKKESKNKTFLKNNYQSAYILNEKIEEFCKKIEKNLDKKKVLQPFQKYVEMNLLFTSYINTSLYLEEDLQDELKNILKNKFPDPEKVFQVLTTPTKPSVVQDEQIAILKLAMGKIKIKTYLREYAWMKNSAMDNSFYSEQEVVKKIKNINDPQKTLSELKNNIKRQKIEFNKYYNCFSKNEKLLIDNIQEAISFRNWRTERYYRNAYYIQNMIKTISDMLKLKNNDIFYLTSEEIINCLRHNKKVDFDEIKRRKTGYVMYSTKGVNELYSGDIVKKAKSMIDLNPVDLRTEIRGSIAYPGVVKGNVRIVISTEDLVKVKQGDILVSPSTMPDYVPVLKKVKAIITDEGGILSHASVISREMRIPCVIGTKIATKVLKDGDLVEVDANTGIVKKIK